MELSPADILNLALATVGGVIAAFAAGAGIFYQIGVAQGRAKGEGERERLLLQIEKLQASISELDATIAELRNQLNQERGGTAQADTDLRSRLDKILVEDERDIWRTFPSAKPPENDRRVSDAKVKVIAVANLKGGVGKSTVATNLAAYLDRVLHKKVLFFDADYQGSSSDVLLKTSGIDVSTSKIDSWLGNDATSAQLFGSANHGGRELNRTRFVTAFYSLASIETRLMIKWLADRMEDEQATDIRYSLARAFGAEYLDNYHAVIIDCPPRFSTATVAALSAATHIVLPTVPDAPSLEASENFLNMASKLFAELNPSLRLAGVVPTLTHQAALTPDETARLKNFAVTVTAFSGEPKILKTNLPHSKPIADIAGSGIALIRGGQSTRDLFKGLGREIASEVGLL